MGPARNLEQAKQMNYDETERLEEAEKLARELLENNDDVSYDKLLNKLVHTSDLA